MKLTRKMRVRECLLVGAGVLLPLACSNEATSPAKPGAPVASVTVTPAAASVVMTHTLQLAATLRDADSNALVGRPVTWTSGNPKVATVSATGLVTGVAADTATIVAASGGIRGTAAVTVVIDAAGEWNFTEQLIDRVDNITCADTGSYLFTQNGSAIGGIKAHVGTCLGPGASWDNTLWPTSLANGQLGTRFSSAAISFEIGPASCRYEGTVTSAPAAKLNGTYSCGNFGGTWEAIRGGAPVASVAVRWDVKTVVGGVVQLVSVLRDAAGHVLDRAVAWSSDNPSVAAVSDNGLVTLHAAGSAHITATSEGKSGSAAVTADVVSFTSVSVGLYHSCSVTPGGAAYCWGSGGDGQLGSGFRRPVRVPAAAAQTPVAVAGGHAFATVSAGWRHSCGVTTSGEAYCWGDNYWGELGDGSTTSRLLPVRVAGNFASVQVGARHSCGLTTTHAAYCWGDNAAGQLGDGSGVAHSAPVAVAGGWLFDALSAGGYHTCGLESSGAAHCWGDNEEGQLGDGTTNPSSEPGAVAGGYTFVALSAGGFHTCGITASGSYCWGYDADGELGTGATSAPEVCNGQFPCGTTPVAVAGGHDFAALSAGQYHSCGLQATNGAAYCWGNSELGQLGTGVTGPELCSGQYPCSSLPLAVARGLSYAVMSSGAYHTCAVTTTEAAYCWGINADGQIGAASTESCQTQGTAYPCATTPLRVVGQPGVAVASVSRAAADPRAAGSVRSPTSGAQRGRPASVPRPSRIWP